MLPTIGKKTGQKDRYSEGTASNVRLRLGVAVKHQSLYPLNICLFLSFLSRLFRKAGRL